MCVRRPADDTPRLVLADYLDDHDRGEAATILRAPGHWWLTTAATFRRYGAALLPPPACHPRVRCLGWQTGWCRAGTAVVGPLPARHPPVACRCRCTYPGTTVVFTRDTWHCPSCPPGGPDTAVTFAGAIDSVLEEFRTGAMDMRSAIRRMGRLLSAHDTLSGPG